jgi:hypothetical protein
MQFLKEALHLPVTVAEGTRATSGNSEAAGRMQEDDTRGGP